jgi:hypothetical protein
VTMHGYAAPLVVAALIAAPSPHALAQRMSPPASGMDCKMLAAMPNPPMSVESCGQMMKTQTALRGAMNMPGGERPGDDTLTCAQIIEEMKTTGATGVSQANAAEGKAAAEDMKAAMQRAQAEAAALAATQTARTAASAAIPGNAAGGANATMNMAEQKALQDRVNAQVNPARDRVMQANANAMADLARSMRENPRFARLVKLAGERNCQG